MNNDIVEYIKKTSHIMSDRIRAGHIRSDTAREFNIYILDIMVKNMHDSFTTGTDTSSKSIIEKIAQDNFEPTFYIKYIKNCIKSKEFKSKEFIEIIDQKYYIANCWNKGDDSKYYNKNGFDLEKDNVMEFTVENSVDIWHLAKRGFQNLSHFTEHILVYTLGLDKKFHIDIDKYISDGEWHFATHVHIKHFATGVHIIDLNFIKVRDSETFNFELNMDILDCTHYYCDIYLHKRCDYIEYTDFTCIDIFNQHNDLYINIDIFKHFDFNKKRD